MINLDKNIDNTIFVTLTCDMSSSNVNTNFVFKLYSPQENNPVSINVTDSSSYTNRYNKFDIPSSSLYLLNTGFYNYTFNASGSNTVIESGKCVITGTTQSRYVDTQTDNKQRFVDPR